MAGFPLLILIVFVILRSSAAVGTSYCQCNLSSLRHEILHSSAVGYNEYDNFFFNDSIIVRFISLFVIGAILFTAVWHLSYHFLPEGIIQGKTGSAIIVGSDVAPTMLEEWGTIAMWNLGSCPKLRDLNLVIIIQVRY